MDAPTDYEHGRRGRRKGVEEPEPEHSCLPEGPDRTVGRISGILGEPGTPVKSPWEP